VNKKMKIKTMVSNNYEDLDLKVNSFEENHNVKATQTSTYTDKGVVYHKAVAFYLEEK